MPLWIIYHPPVTFTSEDTKRALAQAITEIYTAVPLPAFYVNVFFQPIEATSFYIGGVARPSPHSEANKPGPDSSRPFIRITMDHIARSLPTPEARDRFLAKVDQVLKPFIADVGYDWEYSITESSRDLWKVNGLVPPMPGTKVEKEWVRLNEPVGFEKSEGGLA